MAVVKLKKVRLVAHQSWKTQLLSALQDWEMVHLADMREKLAKSDLASYLQIDQEMPVAEAEAAQAQVKSALDYLRRFDTKQEGLIESFMGLKAGLSQQQMQEIVTGFDGLGIAERCRQYDKRLGELATTTNRLEGERQGLKPWASLDVAPKDLEQMAAAEATLGTVPLADYGQFLAKLEEQAHGMIHVEQVFSTTREIGVVVVFPRGDQASAQALRESVLARVNLSYGDLAPQQALMEIEQGLQEAAREREEITKASQAILADQVKLQALYDHYDHLVQRQGAQQKSANTEQVFLMEGWVLARDLPAFEGKMKEQFPEVALMVSDPEEGDTPPVLLENSAVATPFEFVTNVYGWPMYSEMDPTPVLAPFFALFFAVALADAGYGLLLLLGGIWFMRKYDLDKFGKKFFRLFMMVGGLTIVVGLTLNGFFGNLLDLLPFQGLRNLKDSIVLIDPMKDPLSMMILTVFLGVIHVWTGYAVKMVGAWRSGDRIGAILDQGPWLFWI
ncbi:MAG: V-type ATP synthase subunit I, partial [Bacillota bacterium]